MQLVGSFGFCRWAENWVKPGTSGEHLEFSADIKSTKNHSATAQAGLGQEIVHVWLSHSNGCSAQVPEEETEKMINNDIPLKIGNANDWQFPWNSHELCASEIGLKSLKSAQLLHEKTLECLLFGLIKVLLSLNSITPYSCPELLLVWVIL